MSQETGNGLSPLIDLPLEAQRSVASDAWRQHAVEYLETIGPETSGARIRNEVLLPALDEIVGDVNGLTVLDGGCGNGTLTTRLAERGADVFGVDIVPRFLYETGRRWIESQIDKSRSPLEQEEERRRLKGEVRRRFRHSDLTERIHFPSASFDLVFSSLVFMWLPDIEVPTQEMFRVLKPGGRIVLSILHPVTGMAFIDRDIDPQNPVLCLNHSLKEGVFPRMINKRSGPFPFYQRSQTQYVDALKAAGFDLENIQETFAPENYPDIARRQFPEFLIISCSKPKNTQEQPFSEEELTSEDVQLQPV